jgi:hypothetical protein
VGGLQDRGVGWAAPVTLWQPAAPKPASPLLGATVPLALSERSLRSAPWRCPSAHPRAAALRAASPSAAQSAPPHHSTLPLPEPSHCRASRSRFSTLFPEFPPPPTPYRKWWWEGGKSPPLCWCRRRTTTTPSLTLVDGWMVAPSAPPAKWWELPPRPLHRHGLQHLNRADNLGHREDAFVPRDHIDDGKHHLWPRVSGGPYSAHLAFRLGR